MIDADTTADADAGTCAPSAVILDETFTDESALDRFSIVAGGDWAVVDGALEVTNPGRGGVHGNLVVHELELVGDFSIEVDCTLVGAGSAWGDLSVVFAYQDADNYHYVSLNQQDPATDTDTTHGIMAVNEGVADQLLDFAEVGLLTESVTYRLRVVRTGDVVEVVRDDVSLGSIAVPGASRGRFGLGSRNDGVRFSRLVVANGTECPCVDCVEICGSGSDEDVDGAIDCEDSDCFGSGCAELCAGGRDEDGDGAVDCEDSDCSGSSSCGTCTGRGIVYYEGFETGAIGPPASLSCTEPEMNFRIQRETVRSGNYAALLVNEVDRGKRCELIPTGINRFYWGQEYWMGWSFRIPRAVGGYGVLHQHHSAGPNYFGGNGFTIRSAGGIDEFRVRLIPDGATRDILPRGGATRGTYVAYEWPAEINRWFDVVVNLRYSDESDGFVRMWLDGTQVVDVSGTNVRIFDGYGELQDRFYYMKLGIYAGPGGAGAVYYDEIRIGDSTSSYEDVAPGGCR